MTQVSIWQRLCLSPNEIRLLTVYPSIDKKEKISAFLSVADLNRSPTYLALSYTWGDPSTTVPILLNDQAWKVTSNLDDALRCLRDTSKPLTVFVDALCIDQQSIDEKNIQVSMMDRIYSQASVVHCWIGRPDTEHTRAPEIFTCARSGVVDLDACLIGEPLSIADMKSLVHFLQMPYWQRAWIIQEIVLAPEAIFHYGSHQFSKQDLPNVGDALGSIQSVQIRLANSALTADDISIILDISDAYTFNMQPVLAVMTSSRDGTLFRESPEHIVDMMKQAATVKHDHVYAFLSILNPELRQMIRPDYRLEPAQVFCDFAYKSMLVSGDPVLLLKAVGLTGSPLNLPSWVPDFSSENIVSLTDGFFLANEQVRQDILMDEDGSLGLIVSRLDRITAVQSVCPPDTLLYLDKLKDNPAEAAAMHMKWREFFGLDSEADSTELYTGGGTLEEAYWKTMVMDRIGMAGTSRRTRWLLQDDIRSMTIWLHQVVRQPSSELPSSLANVAWGYNKELEFLRMHRIRDSNVRDLTIPGLHSRHMFKTANGYIGISHRATAPQIADVVSVIAGSASPVILRPAQSDSNGKSMFRLVTHAYVAGLMLRSILRRETTVELPMIDRENYIHPHMKVATSWDRIWLR